MAQITQNDTRRMIAAGKNAPYNSLAKGEFRTRAMRLLKQVRELLGETAQTCEVRYNAGGIAVSGEATLHSERVYVQVSGFGDLGILVRAVSSRKDYSGKANHFYPYTALIENGAAGLAEYARQIADHTGMNWSKKPVCNECGNRVSTPEPIR